MLSSLLLDNSDNTWDGLALLDMLGSLNGLTPNIHEWDATVSLEAFKPQLVEDVNRLSIYYDNNELSFEFIVANVECDLLPGTLQIRGNGHTMTIVNHSHHLDPGQTVVWLDGIDITNAVEELQVEIDVDMNIINAYLVYTRDLLRIRRILLDNEKFKVN